MTVSGNDKPDFRRGDEVLNDSLMAFTAAVGEALEGVCSYGLTIGDAYVPFDPDEDDECPEEEDEDGNPLLICTQAWVRVMGVGIRDQTDDYSTGDGWSASLSIDLEVGILRCLDIEEDGAAPTASSMLVAATQSNTDMLAIYCAAQECEVWESIQSGQWLPMGPMGGQYGGTWQFTVNGPCGPSITETV